MVKIEVRHNFKRVFLLVFENNAEMASTLLRFQEHYECPEFHHKVFSINEYKEWYRKKFGRFTYNTDWTGFNFPSKIMKPFREGRFNPLTVKEKKIMKIFENIPRPFYVIAAAKNSYPDTYVETRRHELAHAFYYTDAKYRKRIKETLNKYDIKKFMADVRKKGDYASHVIADEIQAHIVEDSASLRHPVPKALSNALRKIFNEHKDKNALVI